MIWPFKKHPPLPAPAVGQLWKNGFNGSVMRVSGVDIGDTGHVTIYTQRERSEGRRWGMGTEYADGWNMDRAVKNFHDRLHSERRTLVEDQTP